MLNPTVDRVLRYKILGLSSQIASNDELCLASENPQKIIMCLPRVTFSWLCSLLLLSVFSLCHMANLLHSTLNLKVSIPLTEGLDLISMLTDDATVATWNNEGLPSDRMSTENAAILTHCERWPLLIDPQQQGIKWIKNKYGTDLKVTHLGQKGYVKFEEIGFLFTCCEVSLICIKS